MKSKFVPIICAAGLALPLSSQAAVVSWGSWTAVSDNTSIQTPGGYNYGGVNFNGGSTTINNGPGGTGGTDVTFATTSASGFNPTSVTSAGVGPITVSFSGFDFGSTGSGNSSVSSGVGSPVVWGTVLDQVIGDFESGATATISLAGLTSGTDYTVQFFSSTPDGGINATTTISSGGVDSAAFGSHTGGQTRYIIASFTADVTGSQAFTIAGPEPTFSALVIGTVIPEPSAALLGGLGLLALLRRRRA